MLDPVSVTVAAGLVWIGDSLVKWMKGSFSPDSIHTVPALQ